MEQFLRPLHLACIADDMRPNMRLIEIKRGIAQATNGHMLVKIQLSETCLLDEDQIKMLDGKFIDMEVWKECHKCDMIEVEPDNIICHKNGIKKIFEYSNSQGTFFNLDSIIETLKEKQSEGKEFVIMNATFITIIQKIMGNSELTFAYSTGESGVLIYPQEGCGSFAVLMPCHYEGKLNRYFFTT